MQKKSLNVSSDSSLNMVVREGDHEAHPCASPFGQQSCAKRLSCRFVEPCRGFSPLSPECYAKKSLTVSSDSSLNMVVREGFEPSIRCRIHTFQACSFSHSDTSPYFYCCVPEGRRGATIGSRREAVKQNFLCFYQLILNPLTDLSRKFTEIRS